MQPTPLIVSIREKGRDLVTPPRGKQCSTILAIVSIREKSRDSVTPPRGRQCSTTPVIVSIKEKCRDSVSVTGKHIIVNNFVPVSGVPINLQLPTKKGSAAFKRKQIRLDTRNNSYEELMSKLHLPTDVSSVFNPPVYIPDDEGFVPASWFLKSVAKVANSTTPTPNPAPFLFSAETASVNFNTQLLKDSGYNFASILDKNQGTSLSYNSEFRSLPALSSIYRHHDTFPSLHI